MSTGQAILALGALSILMYISTGITRSYLQSATETVRIQKELDAITFGRTLSETMFSQRGNYTSFDQLFGAYDDVTNPNTRFAYGTPSGDSLFAIIQLSSESVLMHGVNGRIATIRVFDENDGNFNQIAEFLTPVTPR